MEDADPDSPTCGKGIAANAVLPDTLAAMLQAMAAVLDNHVRALDPAQPSGGAEADAYRDLVAQHRALGEGLSALAQSMRGYRDLPMADHDMDVLMDRTSADVFAALVDREEDLLSLMRGRVTEHRDMLESIPGDA